VASFYFLVFWPAFLSDVDWAFVGYKINQLTFPSRLEHRETPHTVACLSQLTRNRGAKPFILRKQSVNKHKEEGVRPVVQLVEVSDEPITYSIHQTKKL
jgi:hypothetical protein